MYKIVTILSLLFLTVSLNAQELNCKVIVNSDQLADGNKQIYKTLQTSLSELVNKTFWTNKNYKKQERIECSMILTILKDNGNNNFQGNIQIQSVRPVYNSIYRTPLFNYQDKYLNFSYTEFEPLRYNESSFESDLVSIVSYYAYLILAIDSDSFSMYGGDQYYNKCENIIAKVENSSVKPGWESDTNKINRYTLLNEIQARANREYRNVLYNYHLAGLDIMEKDIKAGKNALLDAVMSLKKIYNNDMTSPILRIFMDAKADEIVSIFSDGPNIDTRSLVDALNRMSATNATKWAEIK